MRSRTLTALGTAMVGMATLGCAALPGSATAAEDGYARPELLVEPADLQKALSGGGVVVLDARKRADFEAARVPSARWADSDAWAKAFDADQDAKVWGERIGALGLVPGQRVVVHDDNHARDAARVWWILRYWGLEDAAILNGNWRGWKTGGFPIEEGAPKAVEPKAFPARAAEGRRATKKGILDILGSGQFQIVDARSEAEHCGTDIQENLRGGAIPGAVNLEWIDLLERSTHRFKPAGELRDLFRAAGIDPAKPAITHCQSGGRGAVMAFALELLGAKDVRNYHASWAEWGNADDTPVVPGKPRTKE